MTQAVTARRDGDAFQARLFWWRAARLLDADSPILRVGFEHGPKAFDDVWVEYDPARAPPDQKGNPLRREHIQSKWHGTPDSYGYANLIDPDFVNANAQSLLQRAHAAQRAHAPDGVGCRFKLVTNWRIDRADPLRELIGTRSSAMRTERLFATITDNSRAGTVRKAWREHLGTDDDALRLLAGTLAFGEATDSLEDLRDHLDVLFGFVGLRRIPFNESAFLYDNLVFDWMAQKRMEHDKASFREACRREGLLTSGVGATSTYGVKSFEHPIDRLQDRCLDVLDLTPAFDERYIRSAEDWAQTLHPRLRAFLVAAAAGRDRVLLAIDAHATLAFAAGSILNIKSGRALEVEQRTTSRRLWSADDLAHDPAWPTLETETIEISPDRSGLAVAVGLTHDNAGDAAAYVARALPGVGRLLVARPSSGAGPRTVACGRHAFELANAVTAEVRRLHSEAPPATTHFFIAAPNAFTLFLGQRQAALGRSALYEFDFDGGRDRSYALSLVIPM